MRATIILLALVLAAAYAGPSASRSWLYAAVALLLTYLIVKLLLRLWLKSAVSNSEYVQRRDAEEITVETADWIGRTGLDEATERELPRYLRRELHEFLDEPDGLKAAELDYLGLQRDEHGLAHFWRMPQREQWSEPTYAYVEVDDKGTWSMGWGNRQPSNAPGDA